jgi:lipoprotein-anchoring transpeptidase ErfK/SrfK
MRHLVGIAAVLFGLAAFAGPASASVVAKIDISEQRMSIIVDGKAAYTWKVSTGRGRYRTPRGTYRPGRMHVRYFSKKYRGAPMPNSIFFYKGYAIHGTTEVQNLGRPASHGCIRLHPANAKMLFSLVQSHGKKNTTIRITN